MRTFLKQLALRLPLVRMLVAKRNLLRLRLRALLRPLSGGAMPASGFASQPHLRPLFAARDREGFEAASRAHFPAISQRDAQTLQTKQSASFRLSRFCLCCNETTRMLVDYEHALVDGSGRRVPNWRERLVCSRCGMNNRQRLVARLVQQSALQFAHPRIYLMEQVTPMFEWVSSLPAAEVHGSEYLGHAYQGGTRVHGVRHEDVMALSYPDASFDLIVSNDVLEHIPDPARAFRECARVLRPGGSVLATFPFHVGSDKTIGRARLVGDRLEHLLPAQYHGNPVSSDGSLVFHDFGWDLLDAMRDGGFSSAECELYSSDEHGHLGTGLLVFRMVSAGPARAA